MNNDLQRILNALPGLAWIALPDGSFDLLNERWCEYTGLGHDEACGNGWQAAIHPEDLLTLLENMQATLALGEPRELEARLRRFDGEYRWFTFSCNPERDEAGQIVNWYGMNFDIEDRRGAEKAVRLRELNFRLIVDSIPAPVAVTTPAGEVEGVNQPTLDYFGKTFEELKGWATSDAVHPDDLPQTIAALMAAQAAGHEYNVESRHRRADGVYRWFNVRGFPLRDDEGNILRWFILQIDIDDRKRAEALLAGEKRLLEMVAGGDSLSTVLETLCRLVESTASGCYCSVVLVDPSGTHLEHGAAPSLPASFINSINGRPVNPDSGPCAMAAYLNDRVISVDHSLETRWTKYEWCPMALAHGLHACFSSPISSTSGKVLGAFAIYYDEPRTPMALHQSLVERFTHIASIAVERAQNDAALRGSEARKAAILESSIDCIVTIDHRGHITEFNPAAERTFGFRRDAVVGKQLADVIIPAPLRESHRQGFARYIATGDSRVVGKRIELTAIRADGGEFPVEIAITRIPLDGPPFFTCYLRDITERKHAEEELRRGKAFLAEGQRLSSTGTFSWRVATGEIAWSEELYHIFEFDPAIPVTLERIGARVYPDDVPLVQDMVDSAHAAVDEFAFEHRLLMPDGSVKYVHLVAHRTRKHNGELEYIGAAQDVTQRRRSEEALGKVRSELAHVARVTTFGALTASIAHEVNQPLSGIVTNAGTCLRMLAADPPNVEGARETARRTIRDGNRASDVITRLRALFARKEAVTELVDLNEAIREVIALSVSELHSNRVVLQPELEDDLPPVLGDRVQLQQVILNLLRNASDAMSAVDDRPRQLVIRTEKDEGDTVRLSVRDVGVGFEPQGTDRLFEAFYTTKSGGMGIGLSVSRSIIENHHGRLWATLNHGPGATFAFSIPCESRRAIGSENLGAMGMDAA